MSVPTMTFGADSQLVPTNVSPAGVDARPAARTNVRRIAVATAVCIILAVTGGTLIAAGTFTHHTVQDQLAAQQIYFPPAGTPGFEAAQYPGLQRYAGQALDNGPKAKAWADQFMAPHIADLGGGKPYGQVSLEAFQHPDDKSLQTTAQTMGFGEVERGLLLSAWGWWVVGTSTTIVGIGALVAAALALVVVAGFALQRKRTQADPAAA